MAKTVSEQPKPDVNELVSFQAAWDKNEGGMRAVTTRKGQLRGALGPQRRAQGEQILRNYGL